MKYRLGSVLVLFLLVSFAAAQDAPHYGIPIDWSSRHVVSSAADNVDLQQAIRRDPRQVYNWLMHNRTRQQQMTALHPQPAGSTKTITTKKGTTSVDWSWPLGGGTVPIHSYPAKYTFDTTSTASCTTDYVVYGLNIAGSSSQPNLVRLNNLYAGSGGLCGPNPMLESAYNVTTVTGGIVQTSPALSIDGTQVAFIESVPTAGSTASVFHVLTWGTTGNNGTFSSSLYTAVTPGGGSPANNATMTSLSYSTASTTYSSPYIDYLSDRAFFGDDNGKIYVTTCVFRCVTPAIALNWPVQVAPAGTQMSPPVYDETSNKIFVGGSDGKLYFIDLSKCPYSGTGTNNCTVANGGLKSLTVGVNNANGGVFDGVILDSTFETMFVFAGDTGAGNVNGLMMQTDVNFGFTLTVTFGAPPFPIYAGALDDAYYQNQVGQTVTAILQPTGHVWSCGALGGSNQPDMYWTGFTATNGTLGTSNPPKMNTASSAVSKKNVPGNPGIGCNPLTEFKNGTSDRIFLSQSTLSANKCNGLNATPDGCVMMYDISTATLGSNPNAWTVENGGTSGIVVDNASGSIQASSVYFANEGTTQCTTGAGASYCAVKLTQSAFQ